MSDPYTIIIGLEVHVQLLTESKMFCGCSTKFGAPPNTQTCPVCIGMPGSLPVMNRKAFELSLRTAVALGCEIPRFTKWDRKNYYYPDLPKGYQISQFDLPLSCNGWLDIGCGKKDNLRAPEGGDSPIARPHPNLLPKGEGTSSSGPRRIGIIRAHLEEDAGKSMHDEVAGKADSRIDLNRTGTPLLEIVSEPDLRSPAEAKEYLAELKLLLAYLGVSDCNMQEGSLRVDANINLHIDTPQGKIATPIVEVKNMNSFRAVERALSYEAERQWREWQETGHKLGDVPKSTRGWDEGSQTTHEQRSKEESSDYRYFPDPDLVPVTVTEAEVEQVRASLGELPAALRARLEQTYGIPAYDSDVLVNQGRAIVDFYEYIARSCGDGKTASNWVQQDVLRLVNSRPDLKFEFVLETGQLVGRLAGTTMYIASPTLAVDLSKIGAPSVRYEHEVSVADHLTLSGTAIVEVIKAVKAGNFETSRGREVLGIMLTSDKPLADAVSELGIEQVDESALIELCRGLLAANPKIVAEVKEGKPKGLGALIGQAKKKNPNVNANRVRELCLQLINDQAHSTPS
jgi:aspartyl-tRNA(Asn)/glutamyl-tRNA(Gln) amidotransferase subunit B